MALQCELEHNCTSKVIDSFVEFESNRLRTLSKAALKFPRKNFEAHLCAQYSLKNQANNFFEQTSSMTSVYPYRGTIFCQVMKRMAAFI